MFKYLALPYYFIQYFVNFMTCKICNINYNACQLTQFAFGHGKSPFNTNQKQKGGFSLFGKKKNPSMFGGKGFKCPEGHILISMETWRT